uniref:Zinc finger protein 715 n=1 Tax=Mus musculus TaxID=10090 RepID=S4R1I9_MOUSE
MTLEGFGFATKKTSRTEDRGAMAADPNFQQKSQPLGAEEQPESCETVFLGIALAVLNSQCRPAGLELRNLLVSFPSAGTKEMDVL